MRGGMANAGHCEADAKDEYCEDARTGQICLNSHGIITIHQKVDQGPVRKSQKGTGIRPCPCPV